MEIPAVATPDAMLKWSGETGVPLDMSGNRAEYLFSHPDDQWMIADFILRQEPDDDEEDEEEEEDRDDRKRDDGDRAEDEGYSE
jgi:hypothetical protein